VQRLDPLARRIHQLLHVEGHRADQLEHLARDESGRLMSKADIEAALGRLDAAMQGREPVRRPQLVPLTVVSSEGEERERLLPDSAADAETLLIEAQERKREEEVLDALSTALLRLPEDARTYLRHRFMAEPPLPPRRIAALMGLPVEDLYRRRGRWEEALRAELEKLGVGKFAMSSV
jgi:DNA-directed RNA polymerase specialized sigma24 family protein